MAIADADYCFTYISVGQNGHQLDASVLARSSVGEMVMAGRMNLPPNTLLPLGPPDLGPMPYVLIGDEAFL